MTAELEKEQESATTSCRNCSKSYWQNNQLFCGVTHNPLLEQYYDIFLCQGLWFKNNRKIEKGGM